MDTNSTTIQSTYTDMLQKVSKNRRHQIKNNFFDPIAANKVGIKSPVLDMSDGEWQALVKLWSTPRHKETCESNKRNREKVVFQKKTGSRHYVPHIFATKEERKGEELSMIDLFKATHNRKKCGFSEPVQNAILEMERRKDALVPEGQEPKFAVEIVAEVLNNEVKQSTFLMNGGLQSSKKNSSKASGVVAAHVRDLEEKLQRSELQTEAMREEMLEFKKKSEEAEAAREKEYQLLRKKAQEMDEKLAHLIALFGAIASD